MSTGHIHHVLAGSHDNAKNAKNARNVRYSIDVSVYYYYTFCCHSFK